MYYDPSSSRCNLAGQGQGLQGRYPGSGPFLPATARWHACNLRVPKQTHSKVGASPQQQLDGMPRQSTRSPTVRRRTRNRWPMRHQQLAYNSHCYCTPHIAQQLTVHAAAMMPVPKTSLQSPLRKQPARQTNNHIRAGATEAGAASTAHAIVARAETL